MSGNEMALHQQECFLLKYNLVRSSFSCRCNSALDFCSARPLASQHHYVAFGDI